MGGGEGGGLNELLAVSMEWVGGWVGHTSKQSEVRGRGASHCSKETVGEGLSHNALGDHCIGERVGGWVVLCGSMLFRWVGRWVICGPGGVVQARVGGWEGGGMSELL